MASKNESDNDIVEYEQGGITHWAARGSRAYQERGDTDSAPAIVKAVAAPTGGEPAKTAPKS